MEIKKKDIFNCEKNMHLISKKSLHLNKDLKKNSLIKKDDLTFIRPGNGISSMKLSTVINRRVKKDLKKGFKLKASVII